MNNHKQSYNKMCGATEMTTQNKQIDNSLSHSLTNFEYYYEVETWCSKITGMIKLTLGSNKEYKGKIVSGKPVFCNNEFVCPHSKSPKCLLQAINIETKR